MRACVRCGLWQAAAADGKCALCVALRWRATRACCVRVRVAVARASACAARAPLVCAVCCILLCACLCSWEAQAWLAGLRGGLRVVVRLPGGVRRPLSPPDRVVGGPGRGHAVCAACEAVCAAGAYVSVRRGTRVCVHAAGAGGRGGRRGLTAVRRPLVFCVTRVGAQRGLAAIALPPRKKKLNHSTQNTADLKSDKCAAAGPGEEKF